MEVRKFSEKERSSFEQLCKLREGGVINLMRQFLSKKYGEENVISHHAYVIAKGDIPVALVAHADTVFSKPPVEFFYDETKNVLWSPDGMGADDRAGIYSIMHLVRQGLRPHVIITTGEESGCIGASKMVSHYKDHPFDALKFIIQLDRRNFQDSVYYDCANKDFEDFITPFGFKTEWGTLSDISVIAPAWGVSAVNFSVGYVEEHTKQERLYVTAMFNTISKVKNILEHVSAHEEVPVYKYIEDTTYGYGYYNYSGWYDDGYELHPYGSGYTYCNFCGHAERTEDMLEIKWDDNITLMICNECYASCYEDIEWCAECHQGWVLTDMELAGLRTAEDRNNWKCKNCRKEDVNGASRNSGAESCKALTKFVTGKRQTASNKVGYSKRKISKASSKQRVAL